MSDRIITSLRDKPSFEGVLAFVDGKYMVAWSLQNHIAIDSTSDYQDALDTFNSAAALKVTKHQFTLSNKEEVDLIFPNLSPFLVGFFDWDGNEDALPHIPPSVEEQELKVTCFYCQVILSPFKRYDWNTKNYELDVFCNRCGRKETVKLSNEDVKKANEGGGWQAFLGK